MITDYTQTYSESTELLPSLVMSYINANVYSVLEFVCKTLFLWFTLVT